MQHVAAMQVANGAKQLAHNVLLMDILNGRLAGGVEAASEFAHL